MTQFCIEEAVIELVEASDLLDELRAQKATAPVIPADVQNQIDKFRSWKA